MARVELRFCFAILVVLTLCLSSRLAVADEDEKFTIIVHPDNPIAAVDRDFLRKAYLKKVARWSNDKTILPVGLSSRFPVRDHFTREVLKKSPAHLKNYWIQRIFSGKGTPPPEANSTSDLISYVLANPGAVGYLPANVDPGGAKVIHLK